jgi:hypothetical protein
MNSNYLAMYWTLQGFRQPWSREGETVTPRELRIAANLALYNDGRVDALEAQTLVDAYESIVAAGQSTPETDAEFARIADQFDL